MPQAADPTSPASVRIQAALRDYFEAPGKYPIGSRQPEVLFQAIDDVLLVAAGRAPGAFGPMPEGLRDAAAFFIGAALLYPGADHYALLGLPAGSAPQRLKERYRLLMRLVHPDFAGSMRANWPKDSAMRVNRAYEVLSSPVLRREYDEQSANPSVHQRSAASHAARRPLPAAPRARPAPRLRIGKAAAWTCIVLLCLMAIGMLLPHRDPGGIVQKPNPGNTGAISRAGLAIQYPPTLPVGAPATGDTSGAQTSWPVSSPVAELAVMPPPPARPEVRVLQVDAPDAKAPAGRSAPVAPLLPPVALAQPVPSAAIAAAGASPRPAEAPASSGTDSRPAIVTAVSAPQAPAIAATSIEAAAASMRVVASRPRAAPTLMDVQPLLGQLLESLQSGNSDQLLHLLEAEARQAGAAQTLSRHYQRLVGRGSPVTLSHAEFRSEPRGDVLIVTGNFRLQVGESTVDSPGEKLVLRALFESRGGRVALTGLSGVTE